MDKRRLQNQLPHQQMQPGYSARTANDYLQTIAPEILASFTPTQLQAITAVLAAAATKPAPKLVDLRFVVDLIFSRFYVVVLVGIDRRKQQRQYVPQGIARIGNAIAAVLLLIGINLMVSLVIVLMAYLLKSALGIDFFPDAHLKDQIEKL